MVTLQRLPRYERWAAAHRELWCRICQSYRRWYTSDAGDVLCARCDRLLIAAPVIEVNA